MRLFTKDTFGYLFQAVVIIFLFGYSPVTSGNKANENLYQKALVISKPFTDLKIITTSEKKQIEPAVFNYIFKSQLPADKDFKLIVNSFSDDKRSEQIIEPLSMSFSQIVVK
jgi:hypothetical protein